MSTKLSDFLSDILPAHSILLRSMNEAVIGAGQVKRWHTIPGVTQTVADHSWGVAMLLLLVHPDPSIRLIKAAMLHDIHEVAFGDIPSPSKRKVAGIKEAEHDARVEFLASIGVEDPVLSPEEEVWLDWADKYESLIWCNVIDVTGRMDEIKMRLHDMTCEIAIRECQE
jgi:hypothetical protein